MKQDLEIIEQKIKTLINLLDELSSENQMLKEKNLSQEDSISKLNQKIYEASQKLENLLGQIPGEKII